MIGASIYKYIIKPIVAQKAAVRKEEEIEEEEDELRELTHCLSRSGSTMRPSSQDEEHLDRRKLSLKIAHHLTRRIGSVASTKSGN